MRELPPQFNEPGRFAIGSVVTFLPYALIWDSGNATSSAPKLHLLLGENYTLGVVVLPQSIDEPGTLLDVATTVINLAKCDKDMQQLLLSLPSPEDGPQELRRVYRVLASRFRFVAQQNMTLSITPEGEQRLELLQCAWRRYRAGIQRSLPLVLESSQSPDFGGEV